MPGPLLASQDSTERKGNTLQMKKKMQQVLKPEASLITSCTLQSALVGTGGMRVAWSNLGQQ